MWRAEPDCEPSSVGMDGRALDEIAERVHLAASEGLLFSGAQVAVFREGRRVLDAGGGLARPRLDIPVAPDTMFVIFSSTKALTALAIHMLRERGAVALDELCRRVDPRGRDLGAFLHDEVFAPLQLADAYLGLPDDEHLEERVAWAEDPLVGPAGDAASVAAYAPTAVGERHRDTPELSIPWNRPAVHRLVEAAAGAIATARDHGRIYAALSMGGELGGIRVLDTGTLEEAITPSGRGGEIDRTLDRAARWGLGWEVGLAAEAVRASGAGAAAVERAAARTFGHLGRGGQVGWADLDRRLAFAFHTTGSLRVDEYREWLRDLQALAIRGCGDG